jgi:hypothetical protein
MFYINCQNRRGWRLLLLRKNIARVTFEDEIAVRRNNGEVFIDIKVPLQNWQLTLLCTWAIALSFCGLSIIAYLVFYTPDAKQQWAMFLYLSFWVYFEYHSIRAWLWHRYGKERLHLAPGVLELKREILGYGVVRRYFSDNINSIEVFDLPAKSVMAAFYTGFWTVGGERIQFDYLGQKVVLGRNISENSRRQLLKILCSAAKS